jgi:hypothetical protein
LHIALVHDWLVEQGPEEKPLGTLMELFPKADLFSLVYRPERMGPDFENRRIVTSPLQRVPFGKGGYRGFTPLYWGLMGAFDLSGYDLIVSTHAACAKWVRNPRKALHVCYFLKPLPFLWERGEGDGGGLARWETELFRGYLQGCDLRSNEGVTHFLVGSEGAQERVSRLYGRESEIIPPPYDAKFSFRLQVYFRRLFGIATIPDNNNF